jgi:predicted MFS family arabinose efflux permease
MNDVSAKSSKYEKLLILIFFLSWGLIFLDRQALSILMPLMVHDINLTNGEIGQINMWQTIGYAFSAPTFALLSDRLGNKKMILFFGIVITSVFAGVTMLADSFLPLLVIRTLLGASEGVILPIAIAMVASVSAPSRLGRNVGFVYAGAAVIASTIGPVLVTQIAQASNWRMAFLFVAVPSLIAGFLIWRFVKEAPFEMSDSVAESQGRPEVGTILAGLKNRNFLVCVVLSVFCMAGLWTFNSFLPLYLTQVSMLSVSAMGGIMSVFGIFTIFWQIFLPYSSDKIGRKPAMIGYAALAAVTPLLLLVLPTSGVTMVVYVGFGGIIMTLTSLFMSIIPVESVTPSIMATASAIIMGTGELLGSFAVGISGALADSQGLPVVMTVTVAVYLVAMLVAFLLKETRERRVPGAAATLETVGEHG